MHVQFIILALIEGFISDGIKLAMPVTSHRHVRLDGRSSKDQSIHITFEV